jgi:3,4-dihydroxy-2-butanone 4-phosphate synthase
MHVSCFADPYKSLIQAYQELRQAMETAEDVVDMDRDDREDEAELVMLEQAMGKL